MDPIAFITAMQTQGVVVGLPQIHAAGGSGKIVVGEDVKSGMGHPTATTLGVASMVAAMVCKKNRRTLNTARQLFGKSGGAKKSVDFEKLPLSSMSWDDDISEEDEDRENRLRIVRQMQARMHRASSGQRENYSVPGASGQASKDSSPVDSEEMRAGRKAEKKRLESVAVHEQDARLTRMEALYRQAKNARGDDSESEDDD